jgi:hypothetical protein
MGATSVFSEYPSRRGPSRYVTGGMLWLWWKTFPGS